MNRARLRELGFELVARADAGESEGAWFATAPDGAPVVLKWFPNETMADRYAVLLRGLDELRSRGEAVNEFASPGVQELAFRALMRAFNGDAATDTDDEDAASAGAAVGNGTGERAAARTRRRRRTTSTDTDGAETPSRKSRVTAPTHDKNLNLRPSGAQSFEDFVKEKQPKTINDRNLVSVFWLKDIGGVEKVGPNQVYTCYRDRKWDHPSNLRNALQVTASVKNWLNTENMDDITVTPSGENRVNDLPQTKDK